MSKSDDAVAELQKVTDGLLYPSDSDEPFQTFCWKREDDEAVEAAALRHCSGVIEKISADEFFQFLSEADDAERFQPLHNLIARLVDHPEVVRVGKINIDVFLIGRMGTDWIGVRTKSIET